MSTSITQSFVRDYEDEFHEVFQRKGGVLRPTVRVKDNVKGSSTTFQKVGKGTASPKARHGSVPTMNQDHTPIQCTLDDYYAGDWVDKLDEMKVNIDERLVVLNGGAYALGRKVDDLIITGLDGTTNDSGSWSVGSQAAVRNSMYDMLLQLDSNDVPQDGQRYILLTPKAWAMAMTVKEFTSADYVGANGLPLTEGSPSFGRWKDWNGALWTMHTGLPNVGQATAKVFAYHKTAVGFASQPSITADITWHGDRAAHFLNHSMTGGACLIEDNGVIEQSIDDTASLPTS